MARTPVLVSLLIVSLQACTTGSSVNTAQQNRLEPFDRVADYDLGLQSLDRASSYVVNLSSEGFVWPTLSAAADTAFLEIHIDISHILMEARYIKLAISR